MIELILGGARSGKSRLAERLAGESGLPDCLTLWLTNLLMLDDATRLAAERDALLDCLAALPGRVLLVSNETGLGVVPLGELSRRYVDEAGWLHQALAERCGRVVFTVAGLPMTLKGEPL
jgi:adenosylcobinamide kinase / adenosylcobinamide-phosphate guanylyltransferase